MADAQSKQVRHLPLTGLNAAAHTCPHSALGEALQAAVACDPWAQACLPGEGLEEAVVRLVVSHAVGAVAAALLGEEHPGARAAVQEVRRVLQVGGWGEVSRDAGSARMTWS